VIPRRRVRRAGIAAANRRAWNDVSDDWDRTPWRRRLTGGWFRRGGSTLWPAERALLGGVRGRSLLHLQCGGGEDSLSWAARGARVTGVDIAERRLESARRRAESAGLPASFVRADVSRRLPFPPGRFDLAYTSRGALVWLPSLTRWGREIARVLKPGGRLLICDEHPFLYCLWQDGRRAPRVALDYFDQRPQAIAGWWFLRGRGPRAPKVETNWKLSDCLNALADAGLRLARTVEVPEAAALDFYLPPRRRGILPQSLLTLWRKP
jgi:ubiquinone/menaquinone biosynthesis C-methylase UbiE